ncbi:outer membrane lipoprotein chaperone LolA [Ignatzschineria larvae DSM 13226]|uniref:Outer-membrane lipoprotein carrier protein n=1 Tax=Ignatzschineria larvae DSM 13226 TaxID=1111732 RepID=A0ABZ3BZB7_9GAMM|nr:outer membrane lipoprotein chaperone LolA [Ignatzschineria larvae]
MYRKISQQAKKRCLLALSSFIFMILTSQLSLADERFIVDYFKNFQTLEANFTQEITTKEKTDKTAGHLIIEKSADTDTETSTKAADQPRFIFDYTEPYHQILVSNGQKFWFYDVDLMQVIIKPVQSVLENPVLQILLSDQPLTANFDIKTVRDRREYLLTPKQSYNDLQINDIQVVFANRKIYSFKVEDVTGQTISFVMKKVVENKPVDANLFDFKVPQDVDVIDESK